jgi:circadian clock protein KaiC
MSKTRVIRTLPKAPSGIRGLDEITGGGLPRGRSTLVCGEAGCGKTLFAMEFLIRGAVEHGEPGVFMAFEETAADLAANVASLGFDLKRLEARKQIAIDFVQLDRNQVEETGEFDLEGLFVRLQLAIDTVGAKRVVLDTVESLFIGLPNPAVLRSELQRLFRWLKERGLTVVITGEKGDGALTRHGLEEYVSDCVIFLDHRIVEQHSTRRLRVVKYRGSTHGTNEYPFLIDEGGISILPISSLGLDYPVSTRRVSTGIPRIDRMLGGKGYYKGSTVLASGTAGSGKTSFAALLARDTCLRGQRCLYFAFEESTEQLVRNMSSIGVDLSRFVANGTLKVIPSRPSASGLERHLVTMHQAITSFRPSVVIVDPITNLVSAGTEVDAKAVLTRLIDFLKMHGITAFFTSLTSGGREIEQSEVGVSSLIDSWLLFEVVRSGGERNRTLTIIKSRGMAHSNQTAEFRLGAKGLEVVDTYLGATGVLTGSARLAREAEDLAAAVTLNQEIARKETERTYLRRRLEARIEAIRDEFRTEDARLERGLRQEQERRATQGHDRSSMAQSRRAFTQGRSTRRRPA